MPASTSFCSDAVMSSYSDRLVADVEDDPEMAPQGAVCLGDRDSRELGERASRCAGVEVLAEVVDGFVGRLQEAIRLRFDRKRDGSPGALFECDEVRGDAEHMLRIAGDDVRAGDAAA